MENNRNFFITIALSVLILTLWQVFYMNPRAPSPEDPWLYLQKAAERRQVSPRALLDEVQVTDTELETPVLE